MLFNEKEIIKGSGVILSGNRMQYMENKDKLEVVTQLFDRGMINQDTANEIFNLPPLPGGKGQKYFIRGEYVPMDQKNNDTNNQGVNENANKTE